MNLIISSHEELNGKGSSELFQDRQEAGKILAKEVAARHFDNPIVYALPRGGVAVAFEVAKLLAAPLEPLIVRKLGAPGQAELAVGALADGDPPLRTLNEDILRLLGLSPEDLVSVEAEARVEIERRRKSYLKGKRLRSPTGHTAILVDDGIATGATMRAGLRALRAAGARKLVIASPVAAEDSLQSLQQEADEIVCPLVPEFFPAVGVFYREFHQLDDTEVEDLLTRAEAWLVET